MKQWISLLLVWLLWSSCAMAATNDSYPSKGGLPSGGALGDIIENSAPGQGGWSTLQSTNGSVDITHSAGVIDFASKTNTNAVKFVSNDTTLTSSDHEDVWVDVSAGAVTLTLPRSNMEKYFRILIYSSTSTLTANACTLQSQGGDGIAINASGDLSSAELHVGDFVELRAYSSTKWRVVNARVVGSNTPIKFASFRTYSGDNFSARTAIDTTDQTLANLTTDASTVRYSDASAGNVTYALPPIVTSGFGLAKIWVFVKLTSGNSTILSPSGGNTIDGGNSTYALTEAGETVCIQNANGVSNTDWKVLWRSKPNRAAAGANTDITSLVLNPNATTGIKVKTGSISGQPVMEVRDPTDSYDIMTMDSNATVALQGSFWPQSGIVQPGWVPGLFPALPTIQLYPQTGQTSDLLQFNSVASAGGDLGKVSINGDATFKSLTLTTTPLGVGSGGTGLGSVGSSGTILNSSGSALQYSSKSALGIAASGANSDIQSLSGLTTPLSTSQGGNGSNYSAGIFGGPDSTTVSGTVTLTASSTNLITVDNSSTVTINLPVASTCKGKAFTFTCTSTGSITVQRQGSDTIDGLSSFSVTGAVRVTWTLMSDGGTNWICTNLPFRGGQALSASGNGFAYFTSGNLNRVAFGTSGQIVTTNGSQPTFAFTTIGVLTSTGATVNLTTTSVRLQKADATSNAITYNLPAASTCSGKEITFVKIDSSANAITIDANGSETISGSLTVTLSSQWSSVTIESDGTNWIKKASI